MPSPTLNKSEIIRGLAANHKQDFVAAFNKKRVTSVHVENIVEMLVNDFLRVIALSLADGEDVKLSGFGLFEVRERKPVTRRNPRTGEEIKVPAKVTLGFKPSPVLKEKVNGSTD
jgi:nucleoid DNA-binding protein